MSAPGSKADLKSYFRFTLKADSERTSRHVRFVPTTEVEYSAELGLSITSALSLRVAKSC